MYSDVSLAVTRDKIMSFVCSNKKNTKVERWKEKNLRYQKESTNNWKGEKKKKHERKKKNELKKKKKKVVWKSTIWL